MEYIKQNNIAKYYNYIIIIIQIALINYGDDLVKENFAQPVQAPCTFVQVRTDYRCYIIMVLQQCY